METLLKYTKRFQSGCENVPVRLWGCLSLCSGMSQFCCGGIPVFVVGHPSQAMSCYSMPEGCPSPDLTISLQMFIGLNAQSFLCAYIHILSQSLSYKVWPATCTRVHYQLHLSTSPPIPSSQLQYSDIFLSCFFYIYMWNNCLKL